MLITGMMVVMLLALLGGIAFKFYMADGNTHEEKIESLKKEGARLEKEAKEIKEELTRHDRPPRAPDCWTSDHGFFFAYRVGDTDTIKQRITDVPRKYRRRARCIRAE